MKMDQPMPREAAIDIDGRQLFRHARCTIAAVHHPAFSREIGKQVVIAKLSGEVAWVYADEPVRYRINRSGRRVIAHDPACIQTLVGTGYLRLTIHD